MKRTMKKRYEKPTCKVILLQHRAQLLTTSNPDNWGYTPGIGDDMNKLA